MCLIRMIFSKLKNVHALRKNSWNIFSALNDYAPLYARYALIRYNYPF